MHTQTPVTPAPVAARNSGMPLGGIGAGSLELRPDGYFYRWYVANNYEWGAGPHTTIMEREGLRFGLLTRGASGQRRHLALGKDYGLDPIPDGWFWATDPYHVPWVQHAREVGYAARIPFAKLSYEFADAPVTVALEAFSPLVPYDVAASNTPGCVLTFTLKNVSPEVQYVSFWGLLKNMAGYDRPDLPGAMHFDPRQSAIVMTRRGLPERHVTAGEMALGVDVGPLKGAANVSFALHPRHGRDVWDALDALGRLEDQDFGTGQSKVGEVGAERVLDGPTGHRRGALCADFPLAPGETATVTFTLAWFFPNLTELAAGQGTGPGENVIGHLYATRYGAAADVLAALRAGGPAWRVKSRQFLDAFYESTLPAWVLDAVNAQFSPLLRSAWLDAKGRFGVWEGLGRCGLQTVDVSHYANFFAMQLWPELDVSQQRLVLANVNTAGKVPHTMHGVLADGERNCDGRIDLCAQFVLAVWRVTLWTGDLALARDAWPTIVRNLEILKEKDADGDGLPNAVGSDQTYDRFDIVGSAALIDFGYVAALHAAAELAGLLGHEAAAGEYAQAARRAFDTADGQLWNGAYYDLSFDPATGARNAGCLVDQLNGDWFYQQTTGRHVVPPVRVDAALRAILHHNSRREGPAAWLANCTWPRGGAIPFHRNGSDQANSPWSGVEYAFAAYLTLNGRAEEGEKVMRDAFERYDRAGMRFDHYECGEFYHRAMAAFAVYNASFGVHYNAFTQTLSVTPPHPEKYAKFLVVVPAGCAVAHYQPAKKAVHLDPLFGTVPVKKIMIGAPRAYTQPD